MSTAAPAWFNNAVVAGVQLLHSLALDGSPAAEVITLTATGWIEVLWRGRAWNEQLDSTRIAVAFYNLARHVTRWPAPRQLVDQLPSRPEAPLLAISPLPITAERREQLAALRRRLADRLVSIPDVRAVRVDTCDWGACAGAASRRSSPQAEDAATDAAPSLSTGSPLQ